jgi:glycosyltransferase involved in cell wall biosynthesis
MKVAILGSRGIPANYGGFETFAEHLAIGLAELGHEPTVYCPHYQEYKESTYKGVNLVRIFNLDDFFVKIRFLRASANLVYDIFSLIHVCFTANTVVYMLGYAAGPALVIPRLFGKSVFVNPDGLEWKSKRWGIGARFWLFLCEFLCAHISTQLITDAKAIQLHFKERFGIDTECIPYGATAPIVDTTKRRELVAPKNEYYLAVARMVPETSIPLMIRGFLKSGSIKKLLIIGPVPDDKFFQSELMPLVDGEKVQYLGSIYDQELLSQYRLDAFCLLHGHASDGTNPSLLESMSCASPVIGIRTMSNTDVLGENQNFFFEDEESLAQAVIRFEATSAHERAEMGLKNSKTVEERFSWAACVDKHLEAFQKSA